MLRSCSCLHDPFSQKTIETFIKILDWTRISICALSNDALIVSTVQPVIRRQRAPESPSFERKMSGFLGLLCYLIARLIEFWHSSRTRACARRRAVSGSADRNGLFEVWSLRFPSEIPCAPSSKLEAYVAFLRGGILKNLCKLVVELMRAL